MKVWDRSDSRDIIFGDFTIHSCMPSRTCKLQAVTQINFRTILGLFASLISNWSSQYTKKRTNLNGKKLIHSFKNELMKFEILPKNISISRLLFLHWLKNIGQINGGKIIENLWMNLRNLIDYQNYLWNKTQSIENIFIFMQVNFFQDMRNGWHSKNKVVSFCLPVRHFNVLLIRWSWLN